MPDPIGDGRITCWRKIPGRSERWMLKRGIATGELPDDLDVHAVLDALVGPVFYRALTGARIPRGFTDGPIEDNLPGPE